MIASVLRKVRRFADDPVLRRWTIGAALGRYRKPGPFVAHRPPYLADIALSGSVVPDAGRFAALEAGLPDGPLTLALPGERVLVPPHDPGSVFTRTFADTETLLAVHRFAWLPLQGATVPAAWVDALCRAWIAGFAAPDDSWAWHPYTAAERAINILDYAARRGMPAGEDMAAVLARHAPAIVARLEYFGDHNTGNHLSNNGRGLYRIGLALGLDWVREIGLRILLAEAERIFLPSGMLREGSTHYQFLLARNYTDAWLAARAQTRPEAEVAALRGIAGRALAVLPHLTLGGGLPLIGDISPDCPPGFLDCLLHDEDAAGGWTAQLPRDARDALAAFKASLAPVAADLLAADGWLRHAAGPWSALTHVPPGGWPPMPGHAHQDIGSFELHWANTALIVDPGRGAYGETGEAGLFASAFVHNGPIVDGQEPFPPNKPYYDDVFRRAVCGPGPQIRRGADDLTIVHGGFSRLKNVGRVGREIEFNPSSVTIIDRIDGGGHHRTSHRFCTPWPATAQPDGSAIIASPAGRFRVVSDSALMCKPAQRWIAYGEAAPASSIDVETRTALPAQVRIAIQRMET